MAASRSDGTRLIRVFTPDRRGRSSVGRAPQSHCGGQGFKSPRLHQPFRNRPDNSEIPTEASLSRLLLPGKEETRQGGFGRDFRIVGAVTEWLVEPRGFEPLTSAVRLRRSPN